ncbi:nucleoside diphosphate kinase [Rhodotorula diobovata]|uniref:Nucleoside diphosphate kinase n=1 Tax=Rhodotorula diobovata TaxID=5288 RepID=A0A5C5FM79_9BASI|nr:nucleoside diphosphate kinase [Rhodotorula diobovata]
MRHIKASGLEIVRSKRIFWQERDAEQFYAEHQGRFYFPRLVQHATSGPFVALALCAPDAIQRWRALIGPTHVYKAQWERGETLRARYGLSDTRNGFHGACERSEPLFFRARLGRGGGGTCELTGRAGAGSDSPASAEKELTQVFESWDVRWWLEQREKGEMVS